MLIRRANGWDRETSPIIFAYNAVHPIGPAAGGCWSCISDLSWERHFVIFGLWSPPHLGLGAEKGRHIEGKLDSLNVFCAIRHLLVIANY